jgi:twinkle protein
MLGFKTPVVSLRDGADLKGSKPVKEIRRNFEFFKKFKEVYICFDNDEAGQISAKEVAQLFPAKKAKIVEMKDYKDGNEYLKSGDKDKFYELFWQAKPLTPAGIVYGDQLYDRIIQKLLDRKHRNKVNYPWDGLNKMTYGIRVGEMVTVVAGSGVGKSNVIGSIAHHILKETDEKIALMMMEESVEMANLRLMSIEGQKPYHLPDLELKTDELKYCYDNTVGLLDEEGNSRVVSFDHFGSNSINEILFRIEHFAALGCRYIFLDHISILVSDQQHGDERRALDEIATKLRMKVQEYDLCLFLVSHLRRPSSKPHEEGGQTSLADIRGTAGIGQLSDLVLGLERNGQDDDPIERNTTRIRVLKNRFTGDTGISTSLFYDHTTGCLSEIVEEEEEEIENEEEEEGNKTNKET